MASRLDRLFVLLESGSTVGTRRAAAHQLGQVQRLHPHELPQLLSRVHKCLKSPCWETRVAGGQAVEAILSQIPVWEPESKTTTTSSEDIKPSIDELQPKKSKLSFKSFKVNELLKDPNVEFLMGSEEKVFDTESQGSTQAQDPNKNRLQLNKRLGLDLAEKIGIDTSDIVSNEDFEQMSTPTTPSAPTKAPVFSRSNSSFDEMSTREINLAKRRARKQKSVNENMNSNSDGTGPSMPSEAKKMKKEESFDYTVPDEPLTNFYEKGIEEGRWPLETWTDMLIQDLLNPVWEVRHGSGIALKEIIKLHGKGAGKNTNSTNGDFESMHQEWLEDFSLRLLKVLALDRFGDFLSDQVVAPVRETVSQCLGTVSTLMSPGNVSSLVHILITFLDQTAWEIRHGALLAIKYLFAIRMDLVPNLLPSAFPSVYVCLSDPVDDVCAVAASALLPVSEQLVKILPAEAPKVVNVLWESLANLDDLSSACNSIMGLLAQLLTFPAARSDLRCLDILIPRLWPFLHHTTSSVRKSALLTLQKLSSDLDSSVSSMSVDPLQQTLRHAYQRALLEPMHEVLDLIPAVWSNILKSSELNNLLLASCPMIGQWLFLNMQHPRLPIDPQYLIPVHIRKPTDTSNLIDPQHTFEKVFLSGSADSSPLKVANTRFNLAKMIGKLIPYIVQPLPNGTTSDPPPLECFARLILFHLNTRSALQRTVSSLVISAWEKPENTQQNGNNTNTTDLPVSYHSGLASRFLECLSEQLFYDEIAYSVTKLQSESRDYISTLKHYKVPLGPEWDATGLLSFDQIEILSSETFSTELIQKTVKKSKILETLGERRKGIANLCSSTRSELSALTTTTQSCLACAVVSLNALPHKLHPVIKPLMDSIRYESNELFQRNSANHLCNLMSMVLTRCPCPVPKIIQNLISYICDFSPQIDYETEGILSLQQLSEVKGSTTKTETEADIANGKKNSVQSIATNTAHNIQRRGASHALSCIVRFFGPELPNKISKLWELTFGVLETVAESKPEDLTKIINALQILEIISRDFHSGLFSMIESHLGRTCELLGHECRGVRHMASRCLAVWASLIPETVMPMVAQEIVPRLNGTDNDLMRQGAIESIWCIIEKLELGILPYIVLLVVPVLGRMSDQNESVRMLASLTFATIVRLMPLEGGVPDPPFLPQELLLQKSEQRLFLDQLLCPTKIPEYKISIPIKTTLRPYQQAGVNWLGFLNKYKLHGILCDDMGLGKTIQSICILASEHFNNQGEGAAPSIVICPPTLTGHWVYEIEQFVERKYLNPLHYHGPPGERSKLKPKLSGHNLVVVSYDIVRNDVEFFSSIRWNYCILDEGHIIKNGRTKISKAIKQLKSSHRLILSGTPIQNNVLELWSLFDFLMPGFLGTEKQFSSRFGRPILLARDPKCSPKDQEAGALAMEALHRQALPFLLRRLKEDVLEDLPPKITQDYYCELSPIQEQLYEDFARTRAHQNLRDNISEECIKHSHIFQALQYLRKVCNHPKLVLNPQHPKYNTVMDQLASAKTNLNDINHSAKLPALKQLLLDCGIGVEREGNFGAIDQVVNQHRALIFCQLKVMLDIVENDLFRVHMPSVTYLRLDGSVPAGQRHSLVTRFNNDPSIDVLLLTTQVGGLGLNLTGADTVIFVEHDWNPMRDLQAMDRAHRIGQKKVVNVYRLITQGTLEEKIMGLQKFKLMTANTVISTDNATIETMATDQLLDLFVLDDPGAGGPGKSKSSSSAGSSTSKSDADDAGIVGAYKSVLENIPDLWDEKLYDDEYDLTNFIKNLNK